MKLPNHIGNTGILNMIPTDVRMCAAWCDKVLDAEMSVSALRSFVRNEKC
jgi:hypothetical protein